MKYSIKVLLEGVSPITVYTSHNTHRYFQRNGFFVIPSFKFKAALLKAAESFRDPENKKLSLVKRVRKIVHVAPKYISFKYNKSNSFCNTYSFRVIAKPNRGLFRPGWRLSFKINVDDRSIHKNLLRDLVDAVGKFIGLGLLTPDYGRFKVAGFQVIENMV